ncbi:MAG: hypothetical protein NT062_17920 [Proteobacteria bacterium]|nr:hypothetical protein [Pseudomonadota bacterium]
MSRSNVTTPVGVAVATGALFALGLLISGMADPAKVIGFLDLGGGAWDPTLAFVMGGAILVHAPLARLIRARRAPLLGRRFHEPPRSRVDRRIVVGAAIFGIGWGLSGYCPGPALVGAAALATPALAFVGAMLVGIAAARYLTR